LQQQQQAPLGRAPLVPLQLRPLQRRLLAEQEMDAWTQTQHRSETALAAGGANPQSSDGKGHCTLFIQMLHQDRPFLCK
jgi:hypothetical protein